MCTRYAYTEAEAKALHLLILWKDSREARIRCVSVDIRSAIWELTFAQFGDHINGGSIGFDKSAYQVRTDSTFGKHAAPECMNQILMLRVNRYEQMVQNDDNEYEHIKIDHWVPLHSTQEMNHALSMVNRPALTRTLYDDAAELAQWLSRNEPTYEAQPHFEGTTITHHTIEPSLHTTIPISCNPPVMVVGCNSRIPFQTLDLNQSIGAIFSQISAYKSSMQERRNA